MRVNTSERMIELYQEMIDGDEHEFYDRMCLLWKDHYGDGFYTDYEYRKKKDKIEEAAKAQFSTTNYQIAFVFGARWYRDNNND